MNHPSITKRTVILTAVFLALFMYLCLLVASSCVRMYPAWRDIDTYDIITKRFLPQSFTGMVFPAIVCMSNLTQIHFVKDEDRMDVGGVSNYSSLFRREILDQVVMKKHGNFVPAMSEDLRRRAVLLYQAFAQRMRNRSVPYFFVSGSLLGVCRHRGFIPWDDDIDVGVDVENLEATRDALSCVAGFHFRRENAHHWKWSADDKKDRVFVDIFFYTVDANYVWAIKSYVSKTFLFKRDDVFPLSEAVFEGIKVPVPKRHLAIAQRSFDYELCICKSFHLKRNMSWAASYPKDVFAKTVVECRELGYLYTMHHLDSM